MIKDVMHRKKRDNERRIRRRKKALTFSINSTSIQIECWNFCDVFVGIVFNDDTILIVHTAMLTSYINR